MFGCARVPKPTSTYGVLCCVKKRVPTQFETCAALVHIARLHFGVRVPARNFALTPRPFNFIRNTSTRQHVPLQPMRSAYAFSLCVQSMRSAYAYARG